MIDNVIGHMNVHIDCHLISCDASLSVSSGEPTLEADVCQGASRMRRNFGDAAAHHSAQNTQHHHTHIPTSTTGAPEKKNAPAAAWRRAETALCVPVSKMPVWQAAQATGSVLAGQPSRPERTEEGRAEPAGGRAALNFFTVAHPHMHIHKLTQALKYSNGRPTAGSWGHQNPNSSRGNGPSQKMFEAVFLLLRTLVFSKNTENMCFFRKKVQLPRSSFFHFSEVAFSTSEKLCPSPFPSSTPSLLSRLPFISRNVLPKNQTTQR